MLTEEISLVIYNFPDERTEALLYYPQLHFLTQNFNSNQMILDVVLTITIEIFPSKNDVNFGSSRNA